jgi:hypothetical protein
MKNITTRVLTDLLDLIDLHWTNVIMRDLDRGMIRSRLSTAVMIATQFQMPIFSNLESSSSSRVENP